MSADTVNDRWNPFSWRAAELARLAPEDDDRRSQLQMELLLAEADETARGAKHLSVAHGVPPSLAASEHLDAFFDEVERLISGMDFHRLRGDDDHLIITVAGEGAEACIRQVALVAAKMNPGYWRISPSACPDLAGL